MTNIAADKLFSEYFKTFLNSKYEDIPNFNLVDFPISLIKALGVLQTANRRQIGIEPELYVESESRQYFICPECHTPLCSTDELDYIPVLNYCTNCGKKFNWKSILEQIVEITEDENVHE